MDNNGRIAELFQTISIILPLSGRCFIAFHSAVISIFTTGVGVQRSNPKDLAASTEEANLHSLPFITIYVVSQHKPAPDANCSYS